MAHASVRGYPGRQVDLRGHAQRRLPDLPGAPVHARLRPVQVRVTCCAEARPSITKCYVGTCTKRNAVSMQIESKLEVVHVSNRGRAGGDTLTKRESLLFVSSHVLPLPGDRGSNAHPRRRPRRPSRRRTWTLRASARSSPSPRCGASASLSRCCEIQRRLFSQNSVPSDVVSLFLPFLGQASPCCKSD